MSNTISEDSILLTIKKMLGIDSGYTAFDTDIIIDINTALSMATQLGIGPSAGYAITGYDETWALYLGTNIVLTEMVKTWMYMKVRLMFDPPLNTTVISSMEKQIAEFEFRMSVALTVKGE